MEETETVTVSGTNDDGLTVTSATLDITNDDAPVYALSVSVTAIAEADGTSIVTVSTGGVSFLADQTIAKGTNNGGTATKEWQRPCDDPLQRGRPLNGGVADADRRRDTLGGCRRPR